MTNDHSFYMGKNRDKGKENGDYYIEIGNMETICGVSFDCMEPVHGMVVCRDARKHSSAPNAAKQARARAYRPGLWIILVPT